MTFPVAQRDLVTPDVMHLLYSDRTDPPVQPNTLSPATSTSQAGTDPAAPDPLDSTSIMGMSKASQRRLNEVIKAAKDLGIPLSKAQQRQLAKELGRRERGEDGGTDDTPDNTETEFSSLANTAVHAASSAVHAVGAAANSTGHFISGHAEQIGVPAGVAVVLGGTAAVAVDVVGGLGAVAALF